MIIAVSFPHRHIGVWPRHHHDVVMAAAAAAVVENEPHIGVS
jgi:hypothetical protein